MRMRDEGTDNHIIFARRGGAAALAATPLRAEGFQRRALHIAITRQRHHHGARFDQAFIIHIGDAIHNLGHTWGGDLGANFAQFLIHHFKPARTARQNLQQLPNTPANFAEFGDNLLALQPGQALQA